MNKRKFELLTSGYDLLEAPLWTEHNGLLFADMVAGGVRCIHSERGVTDILPHRKGVGGMCLHEQGALIVTGKNVAIRALESEGVEAKTALLLEAKNSRERFNDLAVDSKGRIYVGAYDAELRSLGSLYLIDLDGSNRCLATETRLSNGIALSTDGMRLFQADTLNGVILAYDVAPDGSLGAANVFARMSGEKPDGLVIDSDGDILVAVHGAGHISVFTDRGTEIDRIPVPAANINSLAFGGANLDHLFVVTGSTEDPGAGSIYRANVALRGQQIYKARVAIQADI